MFSVKSCELPEGALLNKYHVEGTYTDCFVTDLYRPVTHEDYVISFYTTFVFKLERLILKFAVFRPSTDDQVKQLAAGEIETFAAWHVEARSEDQLLLCDLNGRTRSWLMALPITNDKGTGTRLYFGSAVVPVENPGTGEISLGLVYQSLLGFHKLYSMVLLYAVRLRLERLFI